MAVDTASLDDGETADLAQQRLAVAPVERREPLELPNHHRQGRLGLGHASQNPEGGATLYPATHLFRPRA